MLALREGFSLEINKLSRRRTSNYHGFIKSYLLGHHICDKIAFPAWYFDCHDFKQ